MTNISRHITQISQPTLSYPRRRVSILSIDAMDSRLRGNDKSRGSG